MSTIAVTNVKHPSAVDPAIVLDASGGVNVAGMGLVHIATESFSAVSSVSLNGVFTSAYENYQILIVATRNNAGGSIFNLRLRASGTDSSTSYLGTMVRFVPSSTAYDTAVTDRIKIGVVRDNGLQVANLTIATPQTATPTRVTGTHQDAEQTGVTGGVQSGVTSFDGLTIYADSGTITGTLRVYGYANS